jgi:hypothetical protein
MPWLILEITSMIKLPRRCVVEFGLLNFPVKLHAYVLDFTFRVSALLAATFWQLLT